jgi:hypothetical protein
MGEADGFAPFLARCLAFAPVLSDESSGYVWARPDDLPQPLHPGVAESIEEAMGQLPDGAAQDDTKDKNGDAHSKANGRFVGNGGGGGATSTKNAPIDEVKASKILQGPPVASVKLGEAPKGGYAAVIEWAAKLFKNQGGKANNPEIGEVILNERSAKDSMAHGGANEAKKAAFAAAKDVIEKGAIVHKATEGREDSFYISAPVDISGKPNIVTVLARREP